MSNPTEDLSYWSKRWHNDDAPWHSAKPHKYLEQFYDKLVGDEGKEP